jgi:hypothetical protein
MASVPAEAALEETRRIAERIRQQILDTERRTGTALVGQTHLGRMGRFPPDERGELIG